jgi:RNA polymerase sigma factor (sigma-70 family)
MRDVASAASGRNVSEALRADPMSSLPHQLAPEAGHEDVTAARVEQLYLSHVSLVRSVCRSLLRDRVEAEDAVQQTFLSAQRALLNGSSPRDAAAWLATIARHESLARVRARMRDPLPVDTEAEAGGPDAYAGAVKRHEAGELRTALTELPAQQRDAILMREVRGLSYEEVASALSVTPAAVESLLFRARRGLQVRLREALAALSPGVALRDLAARAGGGFAAPAAAKAVAVGVGAAVITGGALVGPRVIGPWHAPSTPPAARADRTDHRTRASATLDRRASLSADSSHAATPKTGHVRTRGGHGDGASTGDVTSGSDGSGDTSATSDGGNSGSSDGSRTGSGDTQTTSSGSGDTSTTSDSGSSGSDGGTQTTSSGSGETSTTSDGSGSGSDGGTQTTSSGGDGGADSGH